MNVYLEAADLLDAAALRIERFGHAKGSYRDEQGRECAVGALLVSAGGMLVENGADVDVAETDALRTALHSLVQAVIASCGSEFGLCGGRIADWNDSDVRTASDVTSAMRAAAATLRAQRASVVNEEGVYV